MDAIEIKYRDLSYEALIKIIDLANNLGVSPEVAAQRFLISKARRELSQPRKESAA